MALHGPDEEIGVSNQMNTSETLNSPLSGVICEKPFFDAVFTKSPTGIALTDSTGTFLDVNDACAHIFGYSRSELIGTSFQEITHAEDILYDMRMFNDLLKGNSSTYEMTKRFIKKGGKTVWAKVKVNAVRQQGQTDYLVEHIIEMDAPEPLSDGNIWGDRKLRSYMRMNFALLTFCTISSILMLLHIMGIV